MTVKQDLRPRNECSVLRSRVVCQKEIFFVFYCVRKTYGLNGLAIDVAESIATPQGSTYLRGNPVQSNGAGAYIFIVATRLIDTLFKKTFVLKIHESF